MFDRLATVPLNENYSVEPQQIVRVLAVLCNRSAPENTLPEIYCLKSGFVKFKVQSDNVQCIKRSNEFNFFFDFLSLSQSFFNGPRTLIFGTHNSVQSSTRTSSMYKPTS